MTPFGVWKYCGVKELRGVSFKTLLHPPMGNNAIKASPVNIFINIRFIFAFF